jgi:hypothetical protein
MAFTNIKDITSSLLNLFKLQSGVTPPVPAPLILVGVPSRSGLSAQKLASNIIRRKAEAGLVVGDLPSGEVSPDELMERIRSEELIKMVQSDMIITVALPPGITVVAAGASPAGPVSTVGASTTIVIGYGVAQ